MLENGHSCAKANPEFSLYPHQEEVLPRIRNGCILNGAVGSGKSRTGLTYYYTKVAKGSLCINGKGYFSEPKEPIPLYIITTAQKRDTKEWEKELLPFRLSVHPDSSICSIPVVIDSWNNIKKYAEVKNSFFLFDEDKVCGNGVWVKAFLKITKSNKWIILTGTSGDTWSDYIPVFIANGFYKNRTEFIQRHVVYNPYVQKFRMIDHYVNTKLLEKERNYILVTMNFERKTIPHNATIKTTYDLKKYKSIMKDRWDPFENKPIENVSKLCYLLRKVCNSDESRTIVLRELLMLHERCIIFYNFDYELEILKKIAEDTDIPMGEWNGHKHDPIPNTHKWMYLCQYTSAAEGWNCTSTDTMVFYSLNYSYKTMLQSAGRINRLNTPYTDLYFYYLQSNSPIDLAIMRALKQKKKFNERSFIG